jgi:hypothetical protein
MGKIKRPRQGHTKRRRQAASLKGLALYGTACPVSLTVTIRRSADIWLEISTAEGRFFINHDASVYDLVRLVQRGGYWIQPHHGADAGRTRNT